jgi:calcium release-activated calcium channel protein 1
MGSQGIDESIFHWKTLNLSRAKLKASSRTSALLSGFAMVAMVEIQIDPTIPQGLLIAFAVCTVLLIAVHMLAVMISTCILPHVEAVSNLHLQTSNTVFESPHRKMAKIIELAWAFSTVLGILLFLVEIAILCWMKFYTFEAHTVAWISTALMIPIICIFIAFAAHFYLKLVSHKSEVYEHNLKELELLKDQLNAEDSTDPDVNSQTESIKIV